MATFGFESQKTSRSIFSSRTRINTNDSGTCLYSIIRAYSAVFDRRMKSNWFRDSEPDSRSQSALVYIWTVGYSELKSFQSRPVLSLVTTVLVSCQPIFGSSFILSLSTEALRQNPRYYTLYQFCHLFPYHGNWNYTYLFALAQGSFRKST